MHVMMMSYHYQTWRRVQSDHMRERERECTLHACHDDVISLPDMAACAVRSHERERERVYIA